jgi:DNA-binding PadR family transcriptional regulator
MLKYALLALLARAEQHGYELKAAFEALLGGTWPLNIGQVYTVLSKLEHEGLVECEVVPQDKVPDRKVYSLTEEGRRELLAWMEEPTASSVKLRDEIFLKLILQETAQIGDATALIWSQRQGHMDALSQLARWRDDSDGEDVTSLLLDGVILRLEADLKWLELCEERLQKKAGHDDR